MSAAGPCSHRMNDNNFKVTEVSLGRHIGLGGGIALVIGGVIGRGNYALIAAVGTQAAACGGIDLCNPVAAGGSLLFYTGASA